LTSEKRVHNNVKTDMSATYPMSQPHTETLP